VKQLERAKPVIFCGDLNVAHTEDDLANPDTNHMTHGFTDEEREGAQNMINSGFIDTFRMFTKGNGPYLVPFRELEVNVGWRIDCMVSSN
jgi:exodeoxyribonuclease-3